MTYVPMAPTIERYFDRPAVINELTAIRQHLHQVPGLGMDSEELQASKKIIRNSLAKEGIKVSEWGGSLVATIVGEDTATARPMGKSPKTVAWRADIDGLPIQEATRKSYASTRPGRMHACGHDGHAAVGIGIAKFMNDHKRSFHGTAHIIFQPGEEIGEGANAFIQSGFFQQERADNDNPVIDTMFGFHNFPRSMLAQFGFDYRRGTVLTRPGEFLYGAYTFEIKATGSGGHSANISGNTDLLAAKGAVLQAFNKESLVAKIIKNMPDGLKAQIIPKLLPAFVIKATQDATHNTAINVAPTGVDIRGTIRVRSEDHLDAAIEKIRKTCRGAFGSLNDVEIHWNRLVTPTVNDKKAMEQVYAAAACVAASVDSEPQPVIVPFPVPQGDDFGHYFSRAGIPSCYFGMVAGERDAAALHTDTYDYDDRITPRAAKVGVGAMIMALK